VTREVGGIPHRAGQGRRRHRVHELLAATRPAVAIISAGLDNDYGHPHRSTLDILTHDKRDALIHDFFAGSGTTLHATMHLNAHDEGRRRCVLVTNNEQRAESATRPNKEGHFRPDEHQPLAGPDRDSACSQTGDRKDIGVTETNSRRIARLTGSGTSLG